MERKDKEIKFRAWKDTCSDDGIFRWMYSSDDEIPIGQEWGIDKDLSFVTNHRGEGFKIHKGMKFDEQCKMVDALNKRDVEIETLIRGLYTVTEIKDKRS